MIRKIKNRWFIAIGDIILYKADGRRDAVNTYNKHKGAWQQIKKRLS